MKNTLLALLGVILLSTPLAAIAQQFGDFAYSSDGSAITITNYTGPGGAVTIPATINGLPVTTIGGGAFSDSALTSVTIPDSVMSIGDEAFYFCTNLTSVMIPSSVTRFGDFSFLGCSSLTNMTIPGSVTSIGADAFAYCTSLMAITVAAANVAYSSVDGVLLNKSHTTVIQCPGGKGGSYSIPGSVTSIGNHAFLDCTSLTSVTIPGSVKNMGQYAFSDCATLASVTILDGVPSIGDYVFPFCPSLTSVTIPGSVTSIGIQAFVYCSSLTSVTIPGSVTNIGVYAFGFCTSLTNVTIPSHVTSIGDYAFQYCTGLTSVTIPSSVRSIGFAAFGNCTSLTSVTIPGSVTSVGNYAFGECRSLIGVFFKGNAPSLGSYVFDGATNATVYYLPGTTGWGATFGSVPTRLWNPVIQTSDFSFGIGPAGFGFNITGTTNIPIVVEAATNLANATWVPLQSLNLTNGAFYFNDPLWTNYPARTYRIRSP